MKSPRSKPDNAGVIPDEVLSRRGDGHVRPFRIACIREYGPGLRDRIDATLLLFGCTPGPAVIIECAQIPFAIPCGSLDGGRERVGAPVPAITKLGLAFIETVPREISDGRNEEPGKPHAFAAPPVAHAVHPVIPVAGTNQGKPMRSETIGM